MEKKKVPIDAGLLRVLITLTDGHGKLRDLAVELGSTTRAIQSWIRGEVRTIHVFYHERLMKVWAKHLAETSPDGSAWHYNDRVWLNPEDRASTGSVVCFDGLANWVSRDGTRPTESFVEVADCHVKARIHRCAFDTQEHYLGKVIAMRDALTRYIAHLESVKDLKAAQEMENKKDAEDSL